MPAQAYQVKNIYIKTSEGIPPKIIITQYIEIIQNYMSRFAKYLYF